MNKQQYLEDVIDEQAYKNKNYDFKSVNPLNSDTEEDTIKSENSPINTDKLARVCPSALLTAAAHLSINTASGMSLRGSLVATSALGSQNFN